MVGGSREGVGVAEVDIPWRAGEGVAVVDSVLSSVELAVVGLSEVVVVEIDIGGDGLEGGETGVAESMELGPVTVVLLLVSGGVVLVVTLTQTFWPREL